jgi:hypothetical protein
MADIFISYANEDREEANRLAGLLESVGWRVWWDRRIPAGRTWRSVLAEALKDMRCMIVLWSHHSVESPWVAEEAEEARRLAKTLVPVLIERVEPPIGFRAIQAADLVAWSGSAEDPGARQLIADLKSLLGTPLEKSVSREDEFARLETTRRSLPLQWLASHWRKLTASGIALGLILLVWQRWFTPSEGERSPLSQTIEANRNEPAPIPHLTSLVVSAERKEINPPETLKLDLVGNYSDGTKVELSSGADWASSDPRVAVIAGPGQVKALQSGTANITAKVGELVSSAWPITVKDRAPQEKPVVPLKLAGLSISSNKKELFIKEKISLRVKARYSDESEKNLSSGYEWQTSDRTIASINAQGELEALRPGRVEVVARSDGHVSSPLTLVVREKQNKVQTPAKSLPASEPRPASPPPVLEPSKGKISAYINRAKSFREQGNYAAALAELEKAKNIDASSEEVRREIEQTKRAGSAEKLLGSKPEC